MRISSQPGDPGFRADASDFTICYEGEPQSMERTGRDVLTADEEQGKIWFHRYSPEGMPELGSDFGTLAVYEARGKVTIYRFW